MNTMPALLRRFARNPSPWLLASSLVAAIVLRMKGPLPTWRDAAIVLVALAYWPFHEWLLHVFTLHAKPKKIGRFTLDLPVAKAHREHHQDPWNLDKVFIPLSTYAILPLIWAGFYFVLGYTAAVVYFALSLWYEWIHYLTHTRWVPRSRWYKRLWTSHRLHHCKNENYWYGVTMLTADVMLGTSPEPTKTPLSATAKTLL